MKKYRLLICVIFLFLTGISFLLYPTVSNWFASRSQSTAIKNYRQDVVNQDDVKLKEEWENAQAYNDSFTGSVIKDPFIPGSGMELPANYADVLNHDGIMGYLEIPSIEAKLPIYHGTSEEVLQKGIGHLQSTALPIGGEGLHAVLSGHRGLPSSRLFTDLDKVERKDVFYITVLDRTLAYEVDQIKVVAPEATEDLLPVAGMDYITLLTCTPYSINSHRLLVRGVRVPFTPEDEKTKDEAMEQPLFSGNTTIPFFSIAGIVVALLILFLVLWLKKARRTNKKGDKLA